MEGIADVLKRVVERAEQEPPKPQSEKTDPLKAWWTTLQTVPKPQRARMMAVLCRLRKRRVPDIALTEIAKHYAVRWTVVLQPFAYYTQAGNAARAAIVRANEQEWERVKKEWLA